VRSDKKLCFNPHWTRSLFESQDTVDSQTQPTGTEREFHVGDLVLVRHLRPGQHSKWQNGIVTAALGGPRYQVEIDRQHSRQVHIDHLQPGIPQNTSTNTTIPMEPITDVISEGEELEVPPASDLIRPTDIMLPMTKTEPLRRSNHLRTPTRRLIEEIN